jgi:hypothetical protein
MALNKTQVAINFAQGLDTKTDPWQVSPGKFLSLENSVFTRGGQLQKRNGYTALTTLPNLSYNYLTTLNDNLTAVGPSIAALNENSETWVTKGNYYPVQLSTLPLLRNNLNQTQCDAAVSGTLVCTVYTEYNGSSDIYKYVIADSITGQNIIQPTPIPVTSGAVTGSPRVFVLGNYFLVVFTNTISSVHHLQYIAISINSPATVTPNTDLVAVYVPSSTLSWDGVVANNFFYFGYDNVTGGQSVKVNILSSTLVLGAPKTFAGRTSTLMTVTADTTGSTANIYVSFYDSGSSTGYTLIVDQTLNTILAPTQIIASGTILNLASVAQNGSGTVFYEVSNTYSYDGSIPTNYIQSKTISKAGTVGSAITVIRSVGLASKAFLYLGQAYFLAAYSSPFQPTYFLINGASTQAAPIIVAKLAYENGGGYLTLGLPNITVLENTVYVPYLFKDLVEALNTTNTSQQTTTGGVYSQTGINLASMMLNSTNIDSAEIGQDLQLSGGFLWLYDGYLPVEHNFFLWPDSVEVAGSGTSGSMTAQQYYYQVTYEWTDNQGNAYRSAPSIPVTVTLTSDTSVTVNVPTLRLTYKTANPVKIVIYRWSAAQQSYFQVTSITAPTLNSTTGDSITYTDTLADSSIVGNNLIYTTGGVVEDVNAPASNIMTLFDTRLWLVDAEDPNLLWYSKQVVESTPVEMSDLFTFFVSPAASVSGSTGPITALAPMDDKLVIFKNNAIYYINGIGPDNTGANNGYSQPIVITATVGCTNQQSVVFTPSGLMFQSGKGIWLLGRDLSTNYIGAPVELFNSSVVQSAVNVPQTNQVRFTLNTGETLMYDYYYGQWGTFAGVPAISSCIYQGLHTFINSYGATYQESPGTYQDGDVPVQMSFTTSWFNLAGLQGYERFYDFYLLGQFLSPHNLVVNVAYDYGPYTQQSVIYPQNYSGPWGSDSTWGLSTPWGGPSNLEQWRVHTARQTCQSFQVSVQELFNPAFGTIPGAGLTLSGLNCRLGIKRSARPIRAANSVG